MRGHERRPTMAMKAVRVRIDAIDVASTVIEPGRNPWG
ncbi:hypothetical protein C8K18_106275 [Paraburkholderia sp. GV068]|nr:hypothetical protein C8K19_106275 [Paraburkholderia sp. GV072]PUB04626.1 hypothetical protein C8K18_106275 [Paraburkholderia sp. GV068]